MMRAKNFIERSLYGTLEILRDFVFTQETALKPGLLQPLDARVKIAGFILLIGRALFASGWKELAWLYAVCLLFALASRIGLKFFLLRTWVFIPLFSLFIALPALFSPGQPLCTWNIGGIIFSISRQGLSAATIFFLRVLDCVSLGVLLNITTRHFALLKALRFYRVSQMFVMTLGMCYRYIYLFTGMVRNAYLGIKSRVGSPLSLRPGQRMVAWNIVSLWNYSLALNTQVYNAMLSRGYRGQDNFWDDFKTSLRDWLWLAAVILIIWII